VRFVLPKGLQLPAGTMLRLQDPEQAGFLGERGSLEVQASGELVMRPEQLGRLSVLLGGKQARRGSPAWSGDIEVKAGAALQEIELPIDQAVIDQLQELLQGSHGKGR
jgi:hypothetical protein